MFYLLSLITGVLECGWIAFGTVHGLPLWQILCYPFSYHIGNLFPRPFSLERKYLEMMCIVAGILACFNFIPFSETILFALNCITLFLLSAVIQSVRSGIKSDGNRLMKRIFRVGGFALAPLAAVMPSIILIISSIIAFVALKSYNGKCKIVKLTGQKGISAIMMFHQLHYFFYAHITLATVSLSFVRDLSWKGMVYGALLFCGTWITYMLVEPVVSKLTKKILPVFYAGHIGISLLLFTMGLVVERPLFILLWLITGFGGGTVYTISARAKALDSYNKDAMTISENIGHTLGLFTAVVVAALFKVQALHRMLLLGSASAVLAVILMTLGLRKEKNHEIISNESKIHTC